MSTVIFATRTTIPFLLANDVIATLNVLFFIIPYDLSTINIAFATKHLGIDFLIFLFT